MQVLVFAFLVVMGCTAIMVPILLYGFDLRHAGWRWQHAALFTSMVAGTDAVAVSAIIKGGPPLASPPQHRLCSPRSQPFANCQISPQTPCASRHFTVTQFRMRLPSAAASERQQSRCMRWTGFSLHVRLPAIPALEVCMSAGGGPEDMAALLEGESLFNDASAIVLFDIFLQARAQHLPPIQRRVSLRRT